jgi:hypothetical protein
MLEPQMQDASFFRKLYKILFNLVQRASKTIPNIELIGGVV